MKVKLFELTNFLVRNGGILIVGLAVGNALNFIFSTLAGRIVSFEEYSIVAFVTTMLYICMFPLSALGTVVTFKTAAHFKTTKQLNAAFFLYVVKQVALLLFGLALLWLIGTPWLASFFHVHSMLAISIMAPLLISAATIMLCIGLLQGAAKFWLVAIIVLTEAIAKIIMLALIVVLGLTAYTYSIIFLGSMLSAIVAALVTIKEIKSWGKPKPYKIVFPRKFFIATLLTSVSSISFLTLDMILVKHFLAPEFAGQYGVITVLGKMIYFFGVLPGNLLVPLINRESNSKKIGTIFYTVVGLTSICVVLLGVLLIGGQDLVPQLLFGEKAQAITGYIPGYVLAISLATVSTVMLQYHIARERTYFAIISILSAIALTAGIIAFHRDIEQIIIVLLTVMSAEFILALLFHLVTDRPVAARNIIDFFAIFTFSPRSKPPTQGKRILLFNWRDCKHVHGGGAEQYVHELAKRWVAMGNQVTIFCGNDGHCARYEVIDNVEIIRRGGFWMVYIWAAVYYMLRLRNQYDIIVDSENGVPFFTPLYVRKPIILLVHHVHTQVFNETYWWPKAKLAQFIESQLMPRVYRKKQVITVSESSKKEVMAISHKQLEIIDIVPPGIEMEQFKRLKKTKVPSFLYLGRLKPYKNVDIAIKAFSELLNFYPKATLAIAGSGEQAASLRKLTRQLGIEKQVIFLGKVSDKRKVELYAKSWVVLQPSMMEGWGITVIEANACGTPVIASNVNGLKDSIVHGKTGLLVKAGSVSQFSIAMVSLLLDETLRQTLSANAYTWAQKFTWDQSAKKFIQKIDQQVTVPPKQKVIGTIAVAEA